LNESKLYMNRLILGVTHLCSRTRELAETPGPEPIAVMPIRECLAMLGRTVDELEEALEPRAPLPAVRVLEPDAGWRTEPRARRAGEPEARWVDELEENWLLGPDDAS
jgi:hypothetical protein